MKDSTKQLLIDELTKHKYSIDLLAEYNFDKLFDLYCIEEIHSYEDLKRNHVDFVNTVMENVHLLDKDLIDGQTDDIRKTNLRGVLWERIKGFIVFNPICARHYRQEQNPYLSVVEHITSKRDRLLDVGPGRVPVSSILLQEGREPYKVSAMDWIVLPKVVMDRFSVERKFEYFNSATSIDRFDYVVANKACTAIPDIVSSCYKSNKGYFMKLCDCSAPKGRISGWHPYLREIDPAIQFDSTGEYAFNIGATREQVDRMIAEGKEREYV